MPRSRARVDPAGGPARRSASRSSARPGMSAPSSSACSWRIPTSSLSGSSVAVASSTRSVASIPHLATTGLVIDADVPAADAVFMALPHGVAAGLVPDLIAAGTAVIDQGPDFRLARSGRLSALVRLRTSAARPSRPGGLRPARIPSSASCRRSSTLRSRSSARPAAIRPRRCSRSHRSRGRD